jgi:tRNA dimethylallyltransferase
MKKLEKQEDTIAIIGPTASGKSDLALNLARKEDSIILSVDSLSVYKEIDIASAKPTIEELNEVKHFGVNLLYPNEKFDVVQFLDEYKRAKNYAKEHNKRVIIVGGTSFYLKVLVNGISKMPDISNDVKEKVQNELLDLDSAYKKLLDIDFLYAKTITHNDRYRIGKALEIYFSTNIKPTEYFKANPPKAIEPNLPIYEIKIDRTLLREKIVKRTTKMLKMGLIDEVAYLEAKYTRESNSMKSIGIKEVLDYFDGKLNKEQLREKIIINTANLAKRQVTFNKSQFKIILNANRLI